VAVLVVLARDKRAKVMEMVGERRLPVLLDTDVVDFKSTFGVGGGRFFLVSRKGCVRRAKGVRAVKCSADLQVLKDQLRALDRE